MLRAEGFKFHSFTSSHQVITAQRSLLRKSDPYIKATCGPQKWSLFFALKPGYHDFPRFRRGEFSLVGGENDLSIFSVQESTSGHELEQSPVATGFQAYVFESKLDTLTKSMFSGICLA